MNQSFKASEAIDDPLIGRTLGRRFTMRKIIGRGGVGLVYLAHDNKDDSEVVVKVLAPQWAADDEALARFEREAKRLNGLRHPNIVSMIDFGRDDRTAYLVMEYLQGELLSTYVEREHSLGVDQFVPIAAQILKGIGHAHSREMMVRDIKPGNVMLCERKGRANFVKILDFGLAKLIKGDTKITEEHVMGTVGYLSPEQIKGEALDLRVDVYALGVMFYYMLSGRMPFEGDNNAAIFYKTVNEQPKDLRDVSPHGPEIPDGLVRLVLKCLEKDRTRRPGDADEIVEQLIDVVPAAMFRLPRAEGVPRVPAGYGNTGMMEILGTDVSPTASAQISRHASHPHSQPHADPRRGDTTPHVDVDTAPSMAEGQYDYGRPKPRTTRQHLALGGAAVLAVMGGVVSAWLVMGGSDDASAAKDAVATETPPGPEAGGAALEAKVAAFEADVAAGRFDTAREHIDELRVSSESVPALKARIERSERALKVGELMAVAQRFETEDKVAAALGAYRDVLAFEPTHAPAREALARLTTVGATEGAGADGEEPTIEEEPYVPPPEGAAKGEVAIKSRPLANLSIDGRSAGTTPFKDDLTVGKHRVRLTARGYHSWDGTIEVTEADNLPMQVVLRGKKGSDKGPSTTSAEPKDPGPKDPEPKATPPEDPPPVKKNPFLPTSDKDKKNGVFLPTK